VLPSSARACARIVGSILCRLAARELQSAILILIVAMPLSLIRAESSVDSSGSTARSGAQLRLVHSSFSRACSATAARRRQRIMRPPRARRARGVTWPPARSRRRRRRQLPACSRLPGAACEKGLIDPRPAKRGASVLRDPTGVFSTAGSRKRCEKHGRWAWSSVQQQQQQAARAAPEDTGRQLAAHTNARAALAAGAASSLELAPRCAIRRQPAAAARCSCGARAPPHRCPPDRGKAELGGR
jgi:hypothetical protein